MAITINYNLIKSANFNPTKKSSIENIEVLCNKIEKGEICLPLFQTAIRWTTPKYLELLNFQLLGKAPVSPISFNEIKDVSLATKQITFINRTPISPEDIKGKLSTIDGQQRLTCNYKAYINDPSFSEIVLDLYKGDFRCKGKTIKNYQIPVGVLYNKDVEVFKNYKNSVPYLKQENVNDLLLDIRKKFFNYNYTLHTAEDLTKAQQIEWFDVLNLAGSRIPKIQMEFSKLKADGIDIYIEYTEKFTNILNDNSLNVFTQKSTEVTYPISALNAAYEKITHSNHINTLSPIASDAHIKMICKLEVDNLKRCFDITLSALDKALSFIKINALKSPPRIEYITYLLSYFVWLGDNDLSIQQSKKLVEWYNTINFTNLPNPMKRNVFTDLISDLI